MEGDATLWWSAGTHRRGSGISATVRPRVAVKKTSSPHPQSHPQTAAFDGLRSVLRTGRRVPTTPEGEE